VIDPQAVVWTEGLAEWGEDCRIGSGKKKKDQMGRKGSFQSPYQHKKSATEFWFEKE